MKKLIFAIFCLFAFNSTTFALVEVDITRGNLDPLPIAVSPLYVEPGSIDIVKSLLTRKVNISQANYSGRGALDYANDYYKESSDKSIL